MGIAPRTLGFVGAGRRTDKKPASVVDYTLRFLQQPVEEEGAEQLRREFLRNIEGITIYFDPSRYVNGKDYKAIIENEYAFLQGIECGPEVGGGKKGAKLKLLVTPEFPQFYEESAVIIDPTAEFGLRFYNQEPPEYVKKVREAVQEGRSIDDIEKMVRELHSRYKGEVQAPRQALGEEEYTAALTLGAEALAIMQRLEQEGCRFGPRTKNLSPFYLRGTLERARLLQNHTRTAKEQELRPYFVFTNEPCVIATILARYDPESTFRMRERMIACSGVDTARVLKICREKYGYKAAFSEIMTELQYYVVLGRHDDGQGIVALPPERKMPSADDEQRALDELNRKLTNYWREHQGKVDINLEWTLSILNMAIPALQSIDDGLSRHPRGKERPPLCDGYYIPQENLFLSGAYKWRNGFVEPIPVPLPESALSALSDLKAVKFSSARLLEELFKSSTETDPSSGPITKYRERHHGGKA